MRALPKILPEVPKFVAWLTACTYAFAWIVGPWGLVYLDTNDHGFYESALVREHLGHFALYARVILVAGLLFTTWLWFRRPPRRMRAVQSGLAWAVTFYSMAYFAPGTVMMSLLIPLLPIAAAVEGPEAHAPTSLGEGFTWGSFARIEEGMTREEVTRALGSPKQAWTTDAGTEHLRYTMPKGGGDFWWAGVAISATSGRVIDVRSDYYFD